LAEAEGAVTTPEPPLKMVKVPMPGLMSRTMGLLRATTTTRTTKAMKKMKAKMMMMTRMSKTKTTR